MSRLRPALSLGLATALTGCDSAYCVAVPCPLPIAVDAVITNVTGGPLVGLFAEVSAPTTTRIPCDEQSGRCVVPGPAGSYTVRFGATGYQTTERRITVERVRGVGDCACDGVITQQLQLALTPQ